MLYLGQIPWLTGHVPLLNPLQPSSNFYFFKTPFLPIAGQAVGTRDLEWRWGTVCSVTSSPTSWSWEPAPLGQRESGRSDVEKRANISLLSWSWPLLPPCWLHVLWRQTLMGCHFHPCGTCPVAGWLWAHARFLKPAWAEPPTVQFPPVWDPAAGLALANPSHTRFLPLEVPLQARVVGVSSPNGQPSWPGCQQVDSDMGKYPDVCTVVRPSHNFAVLKGRVSRKAFHHLDSLCCHGVEEQIHNVSKCPFGLWDLLPCSVQSLSTALVFRNPLFNIK